MKKLMWWVLASAGVGYLGMGTPTVAEIRDKVAEWRPTVSQVEPEQPGLIHCGCVVP